MAKSKSVEQLQKENEELRKKLAELESLINNDEDEEEALKTRKP